MIIALAKITGGRPMRKIKPLFVDRFTGMTVNLYVDYFGREWMALSSISLFRVSREGDA